MPGSAARLEVLTGKAAGMSLLIDSELVIGRLAEGAGRLGDDEEISRSHARLSVESSGQCTIEDLGSTNGTWVNGMRITTPQTLSEGDTVELGGTTMVVREIPSVEAPAPASASSQTTVVPSAPVPAPDAPAAPAAEAPTEAVPPAPEAPPAEPPAPPVSPPEEPAAAEEPAVAGELAAEELAAEAPAAPLEAPEMTAAPSTLSMQLDIDFGAREIQIRIEDAAEPVRLVFDGDSWRSAPSPSTEKGDAA
jgi:hypothetical protein